MTWRLFAGLACMPACAHVISMSTGQATVAANRVGYILRMPDYEIRGAGNPADALFAHIGFTSGSEAGRLIDKECRHNAASSVWLCGADYEFRAPVGSLGVECSFYEITAANHIHVLRAERDGKTDHAILDSSFPSATLNFRPPTVVEVAVEQSFAGAVRIWTGAAVLVLLFALAVAARTRWELAAAGLAFVAAQAAAARLTWQPPARFAEAVAALSLAYLALETIIFPDARWRWLLAVVFGAFSGSYFATFLSDTGYAPAFVLTGAAATSVSVLALAGLAAHFVVKFGLRRAAAAALLLTGGVWFAIRLVR